MADRDQSHLDATRAQVNEVQNIMKNNVDKIMEREGKLSDLEGRADQLQASSRFKKVYTRQSHQTRYLFIYVSKFTIFTNEIRTYKINQSDHLSGPEK
jgi:hypothetical protein